MQLFRLFQLGSIVAIAVAAPCCSDQPEGEKVPALNLETGETKEFFTDDLPEGWAVCADPSCRDLAENVPCESRSTEQVEKYIDTRHGADTPAPQMDRR